MFESYNTNRQIPNISKNGRERESSKAWESKASGVHSLAFWRLCASGNSSRAVCARLKQKKDPQNKTQQAIYVCMYVCYVCTLTWSDLRRRRCLGSAAACSRPAPSITAAHSTHLISFCCFLALFSLALQHMHFYYCTV